MDRDVPSAFPALKLVVDGDPAPPELPAPLGERSGDAAPDGVDVGEDRRPVSRLSGMVCFHNPYDTRDYSVNKEQNRALQKNRPCTLPLFSGCLSLHCLCSFITVVSALRFRSRIHRSFVLSLSAQDEDPSPPRHNPGNAGNPLDELPQHDVNCLRRLQVREPKRLGDQFYQV